MCSLVFPTRFGVTVGSAEFEKVIKCFEIENKVVFEIRNDEAKDSTAKHNGFQEKKVEFSSGVKQRSETTGDGLDSSFKDLSLESNKMSVRTGSSKEKMTKPANPSRRLRSNSTPSYISSEKLKGLRLKKREPELRRHSTNEIFSKRRPPKSENREAISNHGHGDEKYGETNHGLGYGNRPTRNRRASLPSYVSSHRRSAISPRSPTEKMKNKGFLADADMNGKKLLQRRSSGPETYTSIVNDASSSGKCPRMRGFSLPASKTSEKFPRIMRNMCHGSENDIDLSSDIPEDLGKDVSLEHVFRLWNVRLPKKLANDLKRKLAHERKLRELGYAL